MKTAILIPARYASSRYPGKPLAMLTLPDGSSKSLIQMTWEAANQVSASSEVHVVTDDDRIQAVAQAFGASVIMTPPECENGTARCAAALDMGAMEADLIVNLQGDAPLTPPWFIEDLIAAMAADPSAQVATPVVQCTPQIYANFVEDRRAGRVGGTTAVFDAQGYGLYFSKEVIPYINPAALPKDDIPVYHHVGVYAYRPTALSAYVGWPMGKLEAQEGLEQLRFLENGAAVRCVRVDDRGRVFWELNNPEDVARIEGYLREGVQT